MNINATRREPFLSYPFLDPLILKNLAHIVVEQIRSDECLFPTIIAEQVRLESVVVFVVVGLSCEGVHRSCA
jgi:hypothetical protein